MGFASFCIFILLISVPLGAQQLLDSFSPGAKSIGIGQTGTVEVYDPSALYWNPANLAVTHHPLASVSIHEPYTLNYIGTSYFTPRHGSFALALSSTPATEVGVNMVSMGWGYQFIPGFYGGLSISGLEFNDTIWGSIGLGLLYKPVSSLRRPPGSINATAHPYLIDRLTLGFAVQNLPIGNNQYHHQIRLGASYNFGPSMPKLIYAHHFMPANDSDHLGLLFQATSDFQVFAGLKNFKADFFTFGAGFHWQNIEIQSSYDTEIKRLIFTTTFRIGPHAGDIAENYYERSKQAIKAKDLRTALEQCRYALVYDEYHKKAAALSGYLVPRINKANLKIDSLLITAQRYQNQHHYLNAAAQYLKILKIDPDNKEAKEAIAMIRPRVNIDADRWYLQGVDLYNRGRIKSAEEIFEAIILVKPDHFGSRNYLNKIQTFHEKQAEQHFYAGLGYYSQRQLNLAEQEFRKAVDIDPKHQEAAKYIRRISQERITNANRIRELLNEAVQKENSGSWKSALARYEEILRIQPYHDYAMSKKQELTAKLNTYTTRNYQRGVAAFDNNNFSRAASYFNAVLLIEPSHSGARQYLQRIAASTTDRSEVYLRKAGNALQQQDWQLAVEYADSALTMKSNLIEAQRIKTEAKNKLAADQLLQQANIYFQQRNFLQAMELSDQVLQIDATNQEARLLFENCQTNLNDLVDDYYNRGIELYTEDKFEAAIQIWNTVLKINPHHKGALEYKDKAQKRLEAIESLP